MRSNRLGCFSASGILTTIITLVLITGVGMARGGSLFSPGDLNAQQGQVRLNGALSHADIENCAACHAPFWSSQRMGDRCISCHTNLTQDPEDFHHIMLEQGKIDACQSCHSDHNGPRASLTILALEDFPHHEVGFSLKAHERMADSSTFACSDCHGGSITAFDQATCERCHRQLDANYMRPHVQTFGADCLACHDGLDSFGSNFDHNQTTFMLEGKHTSLECRDCHTGARSLADLQTSSTQCSACHIQDDAHDGRFGPDCAQCHTAESWEEATFDHSQSGFPLTGRHAQIECAQCHTSEDYAQAPQECVACHAEPIYHQGLFTQDCAVCHTADTWRPAKYDQAHTFPINHGESGTNTCQVCHIESLQTYTCYSCHEHTPANIEEKHRDEGIPDFQDCVRCHATGLEEEHEGEGREGGD
jgi:hypothetical protein